LRPTTARVTLPAVLTGRERELDALARLMADGTKGRGGAVLLVGEPGIGKTALLDALAERADDWVVLRADGVAREAGLPFAGLHALLAPVLDLDRLPAAQAQALGAALRLRPPTPHDRFAVPAALLGLVDLAPAPVLALVDDLPWLDRASRDAILFAARRAGTRRLVVVAAARRDDAGEIEGLARLAVDGLEAGAATRLLRATGPRLAPLVEARLMRAAAGNPLALRELPRLLDDDQRSGRRPLDVAPRPGQQVSAAFARQLAALGDDERRALATVAAMERGGEAWLLAALREQGLGGGALAAAEDRDMLVFGRSGVTLRHPLLSATAYHAIGRPQRAAAHRALAATAPDARRRAWHLAAAAEGADAQAAQALVQAARAARAVGGHAEAGEAAARAAQLTVDAAARVTLLLEAAQDLTVAGDADRALALVDEADTDGGEDDARRAVIAGLRGHLRLRRGDPAGAQRVLEAEAVRQLDDGDPEAAARLLLDSVVALTMTGDRRLLDRTVQRLEEAGARVGGPVALLAELTAVQHLVARGDASTGRPRLDAVRPRLASLDRVAFAETLALTAQCLLWLSDAAGAMQIAQPLVGALEQASALGRLPYPLTVRAQAALAAGRIDDARADADAAVRLARETGQETMLSFILPIRARVAAITGDLDIARSDVAEALVLCDRGAAHAHAAYAHAAQGAVELAAGHPDAAVAPLERSEALADVAGLRNPVLTGAAADLVEALADSGRPEDARAPAQRLAAADGAWARAAAARAAVWVDTDADPDAQAAHARAAADRLGAPLERARTEFAIGARAVRARRYGGARGALHAARDAFAGLGADAWAARAADRLAAIGESDRVQALTDLSDDEQRLAVLVSRGLTTEELAGVLHVGPKTVERRLGAVFRKLGVSSRPALARLVTDARRAR